MSDRINPAELLISDYLDLKFLEPSSDNWGRSSFLKNPPRFYRLERLKSCLISLKYHSITIMKFENGEFIKGWSEYDIKKLESILNQGFSITFDEFITYRDEKQLPKLFKDLLKIAINFHKMENSFTNSLAASDHLLTPIIINQEISNQNNYHKETIQKALSFMINKNEKRFTLSTLKSEFNFPDVDLSEIHLEWI